MKKLILSLILILSIGFVYSQNKWEAPAKYKNMKSTVDLKDKDVIQNGKDLWAKHCKSCHGAKGLGDGPKAAMLKTNPGNFTSPQFKKQTEGEIYYKTFYGKDEMPSYLKKIDPVDQWSLVAFMKSL